VGEIKKGRYVYYHCTGYKRKCPEPYTREEVLAERFAGRALELVANYDQIQTRLDGMYLDKLDGRIDAPFFDRKSADWRREQDGILRNIQVHQASSGTFELLQATDFQFGSGRPATFARQNGELAPLSGRSSNFSPRADL